MTRVLGVDTGAARSALVVRDRRADGDAALLDWTLVERPAGRDVDAWCRDVRREAQRLVGVHVVNVVAVERVVAPGGWSRDGRSGLVSVGPVLDAAYVAGGLLAALRPYPVLVDPAGFGAPVPSRRVLLAAYPSALVGPRETTGAGKGWRQHLRAAWDVAGAAVVAATVPVEVPPPVWRRAHPVD